MTISQAVSQMRGHSVLVGAKRIRKAFASGNLREVFLARNADPAVTEPIVALCKEHGVPCFWVPSMTELGRICGIEVGAAVAACTHQVLSGTARGINPPKGENERKEI